mmetsp:Transcript_28217/g.82538  ORF Transcript_28217/g.82538 Transcript_28217/m.82538 type:complete len:97 (-) Transcript_28217:63-353(-)
MSLVFRKEEGARPPNQSAKITQSHKVRTALGRNVHQVESQNMVGRPRQRKGNVHQLKSQNTAGRSRQRKGARKVIAWRCVFRSTQTIFSFAIVPSE